MDDSLRAAIARVQQATGYADEDAERAVPEYNGWQYGERVRIIEDDEREGLFAGDEGFIVIGEVGAPEYGNVRTAIHIIPDGMDGPCEVAYDNIESA
jgi:hypothetical protein